MGSYTSVALNSMYFFFFYFRGCLQRSSAVTLTICFSHIGRQQLSRFPFRQCVTAEKNISVRWGQAGETHCTKTHKQRWWDVLTEGVSFSSDLSLSPCSKNSLVTNSATWKEGKDQWRAASPDCFIMNYLYPRNIRNCCKMSVTMPLKPRW